jgi:L-ribulose-5-phosphate 3-epimerase
VILGYNTNGFAHHRLNDAIAILAELGYGGIAFTPDVNHLDPAHTPEAAIHTLRKQLEEHRLACVIETGSRFLLDPRRKHQPTLLSTTPEERHRRSEFLTHCLRWCGWLGVPYLSFWSGTPSEGAAPRELMCRLVEECRRLCERAAETGVLLAFEPEPGMFIDTMEKFAELHAKVNHPSFGLTLDVGHLICLKELPIREHLVRWKDWLWNIHLDDMKPGIHDHLLFGEGTVDFAELFSTLKEIDFAGMASVELSRHSYDAVATARRAKTFLDGFQR